MNRVGTIAIRSVFALLIGGAVVGAQANVFTTLGSNQTEAREQIFAAFSGGTVHPAGTPGAFTAAAAEARVAMVQGVVAFARAYAGTADFARRYAAFRDNRKPDAPDPPQTVDTLLADQRKALAEAIANAEQMAAAMPSMKKEIDATVAGLKQQLAEAGQDKEMNAVMEEALKAQAAAEAAAHQEALAEWSKGHPADPKALVAARLNEFLDLSATVDFAAKTALNPKDKKYHFVDEELDRKDNQWKMLYRAGQPAVDAARAAAQEWLKATGLP